MPGQDRTGPMGQGPMTGRGMGPCGSGMRRGFGKGLGRGMRRGFGYGSGVYSEPEPISKEQQKKILEEEAEDLEVELKRIKEKIAELSN